MFSFLPPKLLDSVESLDFVSLFLVTLNADLLVVERTRALMVPFRLLRTLDLSSLTSKTEGDKDFMLSVTGGMPTNGDEVEGSS